MTLEQRKRVSESQKKRMSNTKEKRRFIESRITTGMSGKRHSEESKLKMSMANKGKVPWIKGKKHTPEELLKMGESHKGQVPWNKGKKGLQIGWNKGKKRSEESKRKMSESRKGKSPWNKGKKGVMPTPWNKGIPMSEEAKKIDRERTLKLFESGKFPSKENTKPERKIKEELIKRGYKEGIDFIHQFKFMNKFMCDFCFPKQKVIVEVYGDFWHCNPNKYPKPIYAHQVKDVGRDKSREAYIKKVDNNSWTYLFLWEMDINKNVVECVDKIWEVLDKKENK